MAGKELISSREKIINILEIIRESNENGNIDTIKPFYCPRRDVCVIGTGSHEFISGYNDVISFFDKTFAMNINTKHRITYQDIHILGSIAYVIMQIEVEFIMGGKPVIMEGRVTYIFEEIEDEWFIVHSHTSAPLAIQEVGQAYPSQSGMESTIKSWLGVLDVEFNFLNKNEKEEIRHYLEMIKSVVNVLDYGKT